MHLPSQVDFVLPRMAFFGCNLEKKDEGEFELELGGGGEGGLLLFGRLSVGHKTTYCHYPSGYHFGFP